MSLTELMETKSKRDVVRQKLVSALDGYELPEELQALLEADRVAHLRFFDAMVAYEAEKAVRHKEDGE